MQTYDPNPRTGSKAALAGGSAFSLIELLTAVSIMLVIIFSLYAVFNQTQKAMRANITQVDVMEAGRAASEMLGREIEQVAACNLPQTINLYAGLSTNIPLVQLDLDERRPLRTNILQDVFFLSRQANKWVGTGFKVIGENGVGTLYRFSASTNYYTLDHTNLIDQFFRARLTTNQATRTVSTNFHRVVEGVIHLRLTAYDPDGRRLGADTTNMYPTYRLLRQTRNGGKLGGSGIRSSATDGRDATVILRQDQLDPETRFSFVSNAVPGYLELEVGVLEQGALKQYDALRESPNTAAAFLRRQASKVHLFRQRIPIRTVSQQ